MKTADDIIEDMIDVAPFEVTLRLIPYIKEAMMVFSDEVLEQHDIQIMNWVNRQMKIHPHATAKHFVEQFKKIMK